MDRRDFLQCTAILISGVSVTQLGFAVSEDQQVYLATQPNFNMQAVDYLTPEQRKIVAAMAENIIPRTNTPGAIDAGVPAYLELMAAHWLNDDEKAVFSKGLEDIENRIPLAFGKPFHQLSGEQQLQVMDELEEAASESSWYDRGRSLADFSSDMPFICQFKELTAFGFFTSEVGGTHVLRYNPMPMRFDGEYPLSPDDSSWAGRGF